MCQGGNEDTKQGCRRSARLIGLVPPRRSDQQADGVRMHRWRFRPGLSLHRGGCDVDFGLKPAAQNRNGLRSIYVRPP